MPLEQPLGVGKANRIHISRTGEERRGNEEPLSTQVQLTGQSIVMSFFITFPNTPPFFKNFKFIYFERERESTCVHYEWGRGRERGRERIPGHGG